MSEPKPAAPGSKPAYRDPVCGIEVIPHHARHFHQYQDRNYYFCSQRCQAKFVKAPDKVLEHHQKRLEREARRAAEGSWLDRLLHRPPRPRKSAPAAAPAEAWRVPATAGGDRPPAPEKPPRRKRQHYACPKHLDQFGPTPGPCPVCGAAMHGVSVLPGQLGKSRLHGATQRLSWSLGANLALLAVIAPGGILASDFLPLRTAEWVELLLAAVALFWAPWPAWGPVLAALGRRQAHPALPVLLAGLLAYAYSLAAAFAPGPVGAWLGLAGQPPLAFGTAAVAGLALLVAWSAEQRARFRLFEALREPLWQAPDHSIVIRDNIEREVGAVQLRGGDEVRIRPQARIPADGRLLDGSSKVDESLLFGAGPAVPKAAGDWVRAGTVNLEGTFRMKIERLGPQTLAAQIVRQGLVLRRLGRSRGGESSARLAAWGLLGAAGLALAAALLWGWAGPAPHAPQVLGAALAVLAAVPGGWLAGRLLTGAFAAHRAWRLGLLPSDPGQLEALGGIDTLVWNGSGAPDREAARAALARLSALGLRVRWLDDRPEAEVGALARELGIAEVHAGLDAAARLAKLREWRAAGARLALASSAPWPAELLPEVELGIVLGVPGESLETGRVLTVAQGGLAPLGDGVALARQAARRTALLTRLGAGTALLLGLAGAAWPAAAALGLPVALWSGGAAALASLALIRLASSPGAAHAR